MLIFVLVLLLAITLFLLKDINLRNASVHTLKLAEGGSATETVAARGDAVVIEEVRLSLEVDGATVNSKRAGDLIGNSSSLVYKWF